MQKLISDLPSSETEKTALRKTAIYAFNEYNRGPNIKEFIGKKYELFKEAYHKDFLHKICDGCKPEFLRALIGENAFDRITSGFTNERKFDKAKLRAILSDGGQEQLKNHIEEKVLLLCASADAEIANSERLRFVEEQSYSDNKEQIIEAQRKLIDRDYIIAAAHKQNVTIKNEWGEVIEYDDLNDQELKDLSQKTKEMEVKKFYENADKIAVVDKKELTPSTAITATGSKLVSKVFQNVIYGI